MTTITILSDVGAQPLPATPNLRNQPETADSNQSQTQMPPEAQSRSIDDIVLFPSTSSWLKRHSIMPSQWNLSDDEARRITSSGLRITVYATPATCLPLAEAISAGLKDLIVFDPAPLDYQQFGREHMIATLLHEIGHVVNPPTEESIDTDYMMGMNGVKEGEVFADDYARLCGQGDIFADALEIMKKAHPRTFDTPAIKYRVNRIRVQSKVFDNRTPVSSS